MDFWTVVKSGYRMCHVLFHNLTRIQLEYIKKQFVYSNSSLNIGDLSLVDNSCLFNVWNRPTKENLKRWGMYYPFSVKIGKSFSRLHVFMLKVRFSTITSNNQQQWTVETIRSAVNLTSLNNISETLSPMSLTCQCLI